MASGVLTSQIKCQILKAQMKGLGGGKKCLKHYIDVVPSASELKPFYNFLTKIYV